MKKALDQLSRRERQIMELIYRKGRATVSEIRQDFSENLNYSTIRAQMNILERKGYLKHTKVGRTYVYTPTLNRRKASRDAIKKVTNTFFNGSIESVVATLISLKSAELSDEEYDRLSNLIKTMKEKSDRK